MDGHGEVFVAEIEPSLVAEALELVDDGEGIAEHIIQPLLPMPPRRSSARPPWLPPCCWPAGAMACVVC